MVLQHSRSISIYLSQTVYRAFQLTRFNKYKAFICVLILIQSENEYFIAAQGTQGGSNTLRPGPYNPIQNIFFGPLLPRGSDRLPIQQRSHVSHQPQQQQKLHQQNSKSSHSSSPAIVIPPPPPPPLPSRSPKSIGDSQNLEAPTTPPVPSSAPGTIENEAASHNPAASGPGRPPSPNPGLILTPTIDHQGPHQHHSQHHTLQRHKKLRKNSLRKRPSPQLPSRRLPPPRHRPPIHHPRLRGPPRAGPIPHPPKNLSELGKKKKNGQSKNPQPAQVRNQPPPLPPRGTPPTPTIRSPSTEDQHQHLFRTQGVTPPYGSTTGGVVPTGPAPREPVPKQVEDSHSHHLHHHGSHPPNFSTSHLQPSLRNPHQDRPRRPSIGVVNAPNLRAQGNNEQRHHQQHHQDHPLVPEIVPHDVGVGSSGHAHDSSNHLPPPPPPVPLIVDQLHRDIPISDLHNVHTAESHHHPPQHTNTLNIQQQHNPLHETEAPQHLHEQRLEHHQQQQQSNHQQHQHQLLLSEDHVKQLEQLTGISLTRLPLSHETLDDTTTAAHPEEQHLFDELPVPSPFHQQVILDAPSNALFNDGDAIQQDGDHSNGGAETQHHHDLDHHGHHKHTEHVHLTEDALLKISPRGHSSGPVIISQIPVKSFQSADNPLSVKEPMPEKNSHHVIDAVPATSLADSDIAVAQLLTAEARPPRSNNIEAQSRSDDSNSFFYFSQPSDLSASDSEVSSQVAFNSQRIKTKDENDGVDNINHLRSERNGTPRQLSHVEHNHHSIASGNEGHNIEHSHVHDSNHIEDEKDNRRIDNEVVRELVDCGGSDLGFCDMNSRYPGHMMGNLMSDCQELVYKGFVPVPEDIEELGDNSPLARYSNSSKSAVRARAGSWSWKPYTYKKKQICSSELRFIRPGYARDATGKWQVIVQTESLPQRVAIDLCHSPEKPCQMMSDCGRKSRCIQRYTFQHLLAVDPDNLHDCPTIRAFKFPAACVCHIEFPDYHSEFF